MKVNKKSIFAAVAVLLLAAALFVGAGAAVDRLITDEASLNTAIGAAAPEDTLILQNDITITSTKVIEDKEIILNLNGHKITRDGTVWTGSAADNAAFVIKGDVAEGVPKAKLTINGTANGSEVDGGIIVATGTDGKKYGSLAINGGTYKGLSLADTNGKMHYISSVQTNGTALNTVVSIENATLSNPDDIALYGAGPGTYTISDSIITGATGVYIKAGTVEITDSTIKGLGAFAVPQPNGNGADSTGDAITLDAKNGYKGNISLTVSGSTVTSTNGYAVQECSTDHIAGTATVGLTLAGTFKGGQDGLKTTTAFREKAAAEDPTVTAVFTGATIYQADQSLIPVKTEGDAPTIEPFIPGEKSGEVEVTSTAALEYSLIIPADVDLTYGVTKEAIVGVKIATLGTDSQIVKVKMASANFASSKFYLKSTDSESAEYTIKNDGTAVTTSPAEILSVDGDESEEQTTTLSLALAEKLPTAGTYSDTLTFTGIVVTMS